MADWFEERLANLSRLEGYRYSAEGPRKEVRADLDSNENWHIPESELRDALKRSIAEIDPRRYPDGAVQELRRGISRRIGVTADSVVPCSGADQAIDLLCQGFLKAGDKATIVSPTFSMYRLRARMAGAICVELEMHEGFLLPLNELKRLGTEGGVLFICSPNNPTGTQFPEAEVLEVVESFSGLVVLDEAYVEFADFSLSKRVSEFKNLAVLRTFSKAYGMAGLRLGYILANDAWAPEFLGRVQYPYPVSSVAAATALTVLGRSNVTREPIASLKRERAWLSGELSKLSGVRVADSKANFVLASMPVDSSSVHTELLRRGVATREIGDVLGMRNCLRITVGTRRMNDSLLRALKVVLTAAS